MSFMDHDLVSGAPVREVRRARLLRGTLRFTSGTEIPIVVRNLSERGLGLTCKTAPPQRGEVVTVALPGAPEMQGVVRWTRDTAFGVELDGSVDPTELTGAIKREITKVQEVADWSVSRLHRVRTEHSNGPRRFI